MPATSITTTLAKLGLIAVAMALFSGPITDIDFWWHIANGRWIWENRALPVHDPFNIYPEVNYWARTILQGQWGGQVVLYLAFQWFGAAGVITLRVLALGATLALVALRLRRADLSTTTQWTALLATAVVLAGFSADRPQLFSLLLFALTVVLLEASGRRPALQWLIIPVLIVWTNLHQGVLLGCAATVVWMLFLASAAWSRQRVPEAMSRLAVAAAALASPLITPNGLRGIQYLLWLEFEPAKQRISEYASPIAYLGSILDFPHLIVFFGFVAALGVVLVNQARKQASVCALAAMLLVAALNTYRYIPFVVIMAMPLVASHLRATLHRTQFTKPLVWLLLIVLALSATKAVVRNADSLGEELSTQRFPVELVRHAKRLGISGRIFNTVGWGGYLTWELGEAALPYIDGRYLMNTRRLDDYTHILWATPRGWMLFEQAGFDWVIMPYRNAFEKGATNYRLVEVLQQHPDWEARLLTEQGVLFSRKPADANR